jgi:prevent-host-death family protein
MEAAMKSFAFSDLNRQSGEVLDTALVEPVILEKRGKPKIVMMSVEAYERMQRYPRAYTIADAPDEINALLLSALDELIEEDESAER